MRVDDEREEHGEKLASDLRKVNDQGQRGEVTVSVCAVLSARYSL